MGMMGEDPNIPATVKIDERQKNAERFQILMQQGTARVYICNSSKRGNRPAPCIMFGHAECDKTFLDFSEVCDELVTDPWVSDDATEPPVIGSEEIGPNFIPKPFSKTQYNRFVECPRKFMFGTITKMPDKDATVRGTMIHSFAEFRVCYPDKVKELGLDHFADEIASVCAGLSSPEKYNIERSEILGHISSIDAAVDLMGIEVPRLEERGEGTRNHFMKKLGLNAVADFSEVNAFLRTGSWKGSSISCGTVRSTILRREGPSMPQTSNLEWTERREMITRTISPSSTWHFWMSSSPTAVENSSFSSRRRAT